MRSHILMSRRDTGLLVVDVQEKLMALIKHRDQLIFQIRRLIQAASLLSIPVLATEQYPKGLGSTVPELIDRLPERPEKLSFSCCGLPAVGEYFRQRTRPKVLVCGIETHVCILQTALDLMADGFRVFVAANAVASREKREWEWALARMEHAGVAVTTVETALFEWVETAAAPEFKAISRLVTEPPEVRKKSKHS